MPDKEEKKASIWLDLHYQYLNNWHVVPSNTEIKAPSTSNILAVTRLSLQTYLSHSMIGLLSVTSNDSQNAFQKCYDMNTFAAEHLKKPIPQYQACFKDS